MRVRVLFLALGVVADRGVLHILDDVDRRSAVHRSCRRHPRSPPSPTGATLADGTPLPSGCGGQAVATRDGGVRRRRTRLGARSRRREHLACLFRVRHPGSFAFGPQGDRVLLAGLSVQGVSADAPTLAAGRSDADRVRLGPPARARGRLRVAERGAREAVHGRRQGRAAVDAAHGHVPVDRVPPERARARLHRRRRTASGHLALQQRGQGPRSGWCSRKPTRRSPRSRSARTARQICWIAQHAGAVSEIHWMDLADRSTFQTVLLAGLDPTAHGLELAPAGPLMAATQGASCEEEQAMVVDQDGAHPALAAGARTDARARLARREDAPGRPGRVRPAGDVVRGRVEPRDGHRQRARRRRHDRRSPDGAPQRADRGPHAAEPGAAGAARRRRVIAPRMRRPVGRRRDGIAADRVVACSIAARTSTTSCTPSRTTRPKRGTWSR